MSNESLAPPKDDLQDHTAPYALWIDGVGGYLLCLSHCVTIGQAQAQVHAQADIALLADVSRHHATLHRDAEGYWLEALRPVQIHGKPIAKEFLRSGDRFTLGKSCQLQFWQPAPTSISARLDMVSGHRFAEPVQAVLLMADTPIVIGPAAQSHIQVPEMTQPLILFRDKTGMSARLPGTLSTQGKEFQERAPFEPGTTLATDQITLALERIR
ncbi:MAG: FHA domain-containing protein [Planctomycetes bacterium]|nr:FHA domain-containing protein [Planctomycetota bacterium]